jgi:hypothetical protein
MHFSQHESHLCELSNILLRSAIVVANAEILEMFRFRQMKSLVLVCALVSMFAITTSADLPIGPDRELEVNRRSAQAHGLLQSKRQLQGRCEKTSTALTSAYYTLDGQGTAVLEKCYSAYCTVNFARLKSYNSYKVACANSRGAFARYKITFSCDDATYVYINVPVCLVSKKVNRNCGPKLLEDDVEYSFIGIEGCFVTAVFTGYTDYYM